MRMLIEHILWNGKSPNTVYQDYITYKRETNRVTLALFSWQRYTGFQLYQMLKCHGFMLQSNTFLNAELCIYVCRGVSVAQIATTETDSKKWRASVKVH